MNFFERYILGVYKKNGEVYAIRLLSAFIDFRKLYYEEGNLDIWYTSIEMQEEIERVKTKNKRRKNKLPIPNFIEIPWYNSIFSGYWSNEPSIYILVFLFTVATIITHFLFGR